jgi:hypothetical protein
MNDDHRPTGTAERLRRSFDHSFSEAPPAAGEPAEDLLAIRAGAEVYAVRLSEIVGLHVDRPIVALPSLLPELLGIVGIRGSIRPVYDLAALLGHAPGDAGRWLLLTGRSEVIALAFSAFDGHIRSPRRQGGRGENEVVRVGDGVRPIINLASLVEAITQRVRDTAPRKEQ